MMPTAWTKAIYCLLLGYTIESHPGQKMQIYTKEEIWQAHELGMLR